MRQSGPDLLSGAGSVARLLLDIKNVQGAGPPLLTDNLSISLLMQRGCISPARSHPGL